MKPTISRSLLLGGCLGLALLAAGTRTGQAAEDGRGGGEDESEGQKGEAERTGIGAVACVHGGLQNPSRP